VCHQVCWCCSSSCLSFLASLPRAVINIYTPPSSPAALSCLPPTPLLSSPTPKAQRMAMSAISARLGFCLLFNSLWLTWPSPLSLQCSYQGRDGRWFADRKDKFDGQVCRGQFRRGLYSDARFAFPHNTSHTCLTVFQCFFRCQLYGKDHFSTADNDHIFNLGSRWSTRIREHASSRLQRRCRHPLHVWSLTKINPQFSERMVSPGSWV